MPGNDQPTRMPLSNHEGRIVPNTYYDSKNGRIYEYEIPVNGKRVLDPLDPRHYTDGKFTHGLHTDGSIYYEGCLYTGDLTPFQQAGNLPENMRRAGLTPKHYIMNGVAASCHHNDKEYKNGLPFSGFDQIKGLTYENGVIASGPHMHRCGLVYIYDKGLRKDLCEGFHGKKLYQAGRLHTGECEGTLYKGGEPFSGVYDIDGREYAGGRTYTATRAAYTATRQLLKGEHNGKLYVGGVLFSGVYHDTQYQNGMVLSGIDQTDELLYVGGRTYISPGNLRDGAHMEHMRRDGMVYQYRKGVRTGLSRWEHDGKVRKYLHGVWKGLYTGDHNGKICEDGLLLSGVRQRLLYRNGKPLSGVDELDGLLYKDGITYILPKEPRKTPHMHRNGMVYRYNDGIQTRPFTGVYNDNEYREGRLCLQGQPVSGFHNGVLFENGLYKTGPYKDTDGVVRHYEKGCREGLYSGKHDGRDYWNGRPLARPLA